MAKSRSERPGFARGRNRPLRPKRHASSTTHARPGKGRRQRAPSVCPCARPASPPSASSKCRRWACRAEIDNDYLVNHGFPGAYPFTRGVQATGYRGKLWTMRQFAGFGTAEQTNQRFKYLARAGPDRTQYRLRFPDLDGIRQRLAARAR